MGPSSRCSQQRMHNLVIGHEKVSITSVMRATQTQEDFSPRSEDNDTTYKNGVGIYREQLKSTIT
ncbi:hypothetical protein LINPERHAP1_LOCUS14719 [Linum perenne]